MTYMKKVKRRYVMTIRAAQAEATKARIRAAAVELYCHAPLEDFTLEAVAGRAATTVQTVLRAFGNKDELIYTALEDMAAGGVFLKPAPPGDVKAAVSAFFDIYESVGDLVMQRLNEERRRPALKPTLDQGRDNHRDGVKMVFAPQLERLHGAARAQMLTMLVILTDVYVWKLLRRDMALSRPAAEAIVHKMILGVTEQEKADDTDSLAELVGRRQPAS
jgi:AcrR family transcriptional regulator